MCATLNAAKRLYRNDKVFFCYPYNYFYTYLEVFFMCKNNFVDLDSMTDEEIDELYRPRKTNSEKSLLSLFVFLILKEHSSSKRHLTHKQILEYLAEYPYELKIERKALGRCLNLLKMLNLDIYSDSRYGSWMEQ